MIILDGKATADRLNLKLKERIYEGGYEIRFSLIMVASNPASEIYVNNKIKACELVGINVKLLRASENIPEKELIDMIERENLDSKVSAILVQLPLPKHINERKVLNSINPSKDVDGLSLLNQGKLFYNEVGIRPATPLAVITLLQEYGIKLEGKRVVIVGRSNLVGKPLAMMFLEADASVTITHSKSTNLKDICKEADILVVAIGNPKFIKPDYIKKDSCVIDVGINRVEGKLVGDVDFDSVSPLVKYITPVPKGIGPMTVHCLLMNIYESYLKFSK